VLNLVHLLTRLFDVATFFEVETIKLPINEASSLL